MAKFFESSISSAMGDGGMASDCVKVDYLCDRFDCIFDLTDQFTGEFNLLAQKMRSDEIDLATAQRGITLLRDDFRTLLRNFWKEVVPLMATKDIEKNALLMENMIYNITSFVRTQFQMAFDVDQKGILFEVWKENDQLFVSPESQKGLGESKSGKYINPKKKLFLVQKTHNA